LGDGRRHKNSRSGLSHAADLPLALLVGASSGLFDAVRSAHEPLVRFFEPLSLGTAHPGDAIRALTESLEEAVVPFDPEVVAEIVDLAGGRPYYLQMLGYFAFDAATNGRVTEAEFAAAIGSIPDDWLRALGPAASPERLAPIVKYVAAMRRQTPGVLPDADRVCLVETLRCPSGRGRCPITTSARGRLRTADRLGVRARATRQCAQHAVSRPT